MFKRFTLHELIKPTGLSQNGQQMVMRRWPRLIFPKSRVTLPMTWTAGMRLPQMADKFAPCMLLVT